MLSNTYFTTVYNKAWNCVSAPQKTKVTKPTVPLQRMNSQVIDTSILSISNNQLNGSRNTGLLHLCVSIMTGTALSQDISTQQWLLTLTGNLFSGNTCKQF